MIAFKCKVGYFPQAINGGNVTKYSIADMTVTDEGYWTIGTVFTGNVAPGTYNPVDSIASMALVDSAITRDEFAICWMMINLNDVGGSYRNPYPRQLMPWCYSAWKNANDIVGSAQMSANRFGVYLESLDRMLISNGSSTTSFYGIANGNSGGKFTLMYVWNNVNIFNGTFTGQSFGRIIIPSYSSPDDLLNLNKYMYFGAVVNTPNLRDITFSYYDDFSTGAKTDWGQCVEALFGSYIRGGGKPDFVTPVNPYQPGTPSGPTDPDIPPGTFDDDSDPIPDSPIPTISAANTGFTRIYNPTLSQVQALARYLWTDESVIQTIWNHLKQYFEDPMQAMIGFNLVPCAVPDGGTEEFALMYIGTGVTMTVAANQFVDVDCGTLEVERYYGSALDQSPYTKITCFLPYIGQVQLDVDEVMGTTLQVKYRIDIVSGSCVAKVFVDGSCLYQFSGHCAINIPFSSADFSSYVSAAINVAKLAVGAIAGGAAGALAASAGEVSQETGNSITRTVETTSTVRNPTTGRQVTMGTQRYVETIDKPQQSGSTKASFAGLSPANISNTVGQIMSSKTIVQHSGSFSGNSGYLGIRRPYLIIERPRMCLPEDYQSMNGYPSMITLKLSDCQGYTRVQQVQLTGCWATNPEQAEILELLKSGVVF